MSTGTKVLVVGAGEVGRSLYNVIKDSCEAEIVDKDQVSEMSPEIMHVCFPYSENFVQYVKEYVEKYKPIVTVINSTVPVGTTESLGKGFVHSPIRGKHPNLEGGIRTFTKEVGGDEPELCQMVANHFTLAGIPTMYRGLSAKNTEFAKIMCTTYYGWAIVFAKEMKKLCNEYGLDFEAVYTEWNKDYNAGYVALGMPQYFRPVLDDMPGKIGGHCVAQNCELENNLLTRLVKEYNDKI